MGTSAFGQNAPEGWPLHNPGRAHLHWEWGRDYTQARAYFIQYTLRIWKEKIQTCEI